MYKRIWLKFKSLNTEQEDKGQLDHDDSAEKIMPYKIESKHNLYIKVKC